MTHAIRRVTRFDVVGPYTLAIVFADGTQQQIDFCRCHVVRSSDRCKI